jgi:hypothetical protein
LPQKEKTMTSSHKPFAIIALVGILGTGVTASANPDDRRHPQDREPVILETYSGSEEPAPIIDSTPSAQQVLPNSMEERGNRDNR